MPGIFEFLLFQIGWWTCAWSAGQDVAWIGALIVLLIAVIHWVYTPSEKKPRRLALTGITLLVGLALETAMLRLDVYFATANPGSPLPGLFMAALWINFALTLDGMLLPLAKHPIIAAILGAVGGPMAYWGGAGLGAIHLGDRPLRSILLLAIAWGTILPLLLSLASRLHRPVADRLDPLPSD